MIIKNKTNQIQELSVLDRNNTSLTYSIYLQANDLLELDRNLIILNLTNLERLGIVTQVDKEVVKPVVQEELNKEEEAPVLKEEEKDERVSVDEEVEIQEEVAAVSEEEPEEEEKPSTFVCKICNKEYASERGLATHMNKVHKD